MMGMLCGCLQEVPLTDKEMNAVAEYAAGVLLENDDSIYTSALLSKTVMEELLTPTPTATPVPTPTSIVNNQSGTTSQGQGSLATITPLPGDSEETIEQLTQLIGQEGVQLSYQGYVLQDSIVSNEYLNMEAEEGNQYVIAQFQIENLTEKELVFDASNKNLSCILAINVDNRYRAALSMLENNLQYMPITVPAKQTKSAVLVFEVKKQEMDTINLILRNNTDNVVLPALLFPPTITTFPTISS